MASEAAGGQASASRWGPNDRIGALNLQTEQSVLGAMSLVTQGKVYSLGMPVSKDGPPAYPPRFYNVVLTNSNPGESAEGAPAGKVDYVDDLLLTHCGSTTHWDLPFHVHRHGTHYGDHKSNDIVKRDGMAKSFGCEEVKPMITRGVLIDMAEYYGVDIVPAGKAYTMDDITAATTQQGIEIRKGDAVLFYSGWLKLAAGNLRDDKRYLAGEPGLGLTGADYLISQDVMVVAADTVALEVLPSENPDDQFPVHGKLLIDNGIGIQEMVNSQPLVDNNVKEFCYMFIPPRFTGVVQLPGNPVAIV